MAIFRTTITPLVRRSIRQFASKKEINWNRAWDAQGRYIKSIEKLNEQCLETFRLKLPNVESELLRLRNNFNLRGALEFALEEYKNTRGLKHISKPDSELLETEYEICPKSTLARYQLRKTDVNAGTMVLYHELSRHAHGNTGELVVRDMEHTMTEVAAIESVFCSLRKLECFRIPVKLVIDKKEHTLQ